MDPSGEPRDPSDASTEPVMEQAKARVGVMLKDKWRLDALLGVGGMAAVYAATHRNGKRVAVKVLHRELSIDEAVHQRFLREGYLANRVGHRGAVAVDDDDTTDDGAAFLVMELLDGETLEERMIRKGGFVPATEALSAMDQVLETLGHAHARGVVHRDLKPENLFLGRDGVMKVLDFGIARLREHSGSTSSTMTGSLMGTPSFMAPEQARGRWDDVDARTDLWAVGASLFTLLTGRFVHEAETVNEALVKAVTERAPSLSSILPAAHPSVVAFIDRALAYERNDRFQSAAEMQAALRSALDALTGGDALAPLSVPEGRLEPAPPFSVSVPRSKTSTVTTSRGVTLSVQQPAPPEPKRWARPSGGVLAVVGLLSAAVALESVALFGKARSVARGPAAATETAPTSEKASPAPERAASPVVPPAAPTPMAPTEPGPAAVEAPSAAAAAPVRRSVTVKAAPRAAKTPAPAKTRAADPFARRQ